MSGEELKPYLTAIDVSYANIARKLDMSAQNFDKMLKVKDIKTGLIERLSKIYNKPVSWFFDEKETPKVKVEAFNDSLNLGNTLAVGEPDTILKEITLLQKLLFEKDERIKELKERIEELKSK